MITNPRIVVLSIGYILSIFTTTAMASLGLERGWYVEGNVGYANINNTDFGNNTKIDSSNWGYNLNVGYKFIPYFALELGYTRYSTSDIDFNNTMVAKYTPNAWDLTTKAILPIQNSGFNLYAKLGVARISAKMSIYDQNVINANHLNITEGTTDATGLYYGVGGEYFMWPSTAIHVAWVEAIGTSETGNMALTSIGISHIFG